MVNLITFHFFEALNDAFEVQFIQGLSFTPYQRHMWDHAAQIFFFKWKHC